MTVLIELRDIRKSFGPVDVLKGVDLKIHAGQGQRAGRRQRCRQVDADQGLSGAQPYDTGEVLFEGSPSP